MTCVVAVIENGKVWMGADSAGVAGYSLTVRKDPKIFRVGDALIGFTSSFRMGQLLGYRLSLPKRHQDVSVDQYMHTVFIDAVRDALKAGGYSANQNGREDAGVFLVGYEGRLFKIENDYQIGESLLPYRACGCGEDLALGSLYSTVGQPANLRLEKALQAAEAFSAGVCPPFRFDSV